MAAIFGGAEVVVVTGGRVEQMKAARFRCTGVVGADVVVVAVGLIGADALAHATVVAQGAGVAIVTIALGWSEGATGVSAAAIDGAWVVVLACQCWAALALAVGATVQRRADVAIVAGRTVVLMQAALCRRTGVIGTAVTVVAIGR